VNITAGVNINHGSRGPTPARSRCGARRLAILARAAGACVLALICGATAFAQDTHLLVITGVSGDDEHAKMFHALALKIIDAAKTKDSLPDANITYLGERTETDPARIRARSTKENVEKAITDVAAKAKPDDTVVVLLIGHGTFDGRTASFNLPGPDLTVADWEKLLAKLSKQRVAFVNTAPASGAFLPAVAGPGRAIVTATKTGGERNETRFAEFFVAAFGDPAADSDRNGHVSMLEAFTYAKDKVVRAFQADGLLLTEHATLDDGADGKLAGSMFLTGHPSDAGLNVDRADPALAALADERDALQKQIDALKLRKATMDPARYEQDMEKLLTDLALKTKAIRDLQARKK
jgi:hypothetical protein